MILNPMKPLVLSCTFALLTLGSVHAQSGSEADLEQLGKISQSFVDAFNAKNAEDIAKLFVPDGEVVLASGEIVLGHSDLIDHYTTSFAENSSLQAALEASSVRFITPTLVTEDGTVHLTHESGEISSHHYTAVQVKQEDGSWLYASVRDQEGDHALPDEKLLALKGLVGDWVIQTQEVDTWISFQWSDDGPYIDAKLLTQAATIQSTAATFRIGWNEKSESFNSWAFDDQGGFTHSRWTASSPNEWLLKTNGVTASGETHNATQTIAIDPSGESFSWSKRDQIIGGEVQPPNSVRAVKRPPLPATASAE